MSLGEQIKKYRNEKGFTQVELALKAGISRSYLADVERDRYNPSLDTLKNIAQALNIDTSQLLSPEAMVLRKEIAAMDGLQAILKFLYDRVELNYTHSSTGEELDCDLDYFVQLTKGDAEYYLDRREFEILFNFVLSNIPNYINLIKAQK